MKARTLALLGVLLLLGLTSIWFFWSRPTVEVFIARRGTAVSAIYGTVKIVPTLTFNLRARESGILHYGSGLGEAASLAGREVKKGELLGWVTNDDLDRAYTKAEVEWKAAQQSSELGPASAPALKTQEALAARLGNLSAQKNIPQVELERARNELTSMTEAVHRQQIELERAGALAQQEFDKLKDRKELCRLISPIDGTLQSVQGGDGEFINEGNPTFVIISKTMLLEGQIDEEDVGRVVPGMKATVKLYALPDQTLKERVLQLRPGANNQRYTVSLTLENAPTNVMIDMSGEMNIISGERRNVIIIPARALVGDRVWVAEGGVVRPRLVKAGFRNVERAEIREGLREGEAVVVADQDLLRPGGRVRVAVINP